MSETAEIILGIAEEMIATKGYAAFSFREIAVVLGIKSASVHYHFPTKLHLGLAVASRYRARYRGALEAIDQAGGTPEASLRTLIDIYRQQITDGERMSVCMMLAAEIKQLPEEIREEMHAFYGLNIDWFQGLIERQFPSLPPQDARSRACQLFALLQGALMGAKTQGDPEYFEAAVAALPSLWLPWTLRR